MIIGIFSDIHGNLIALEQCLLLFNRLGVEKSFFLGDAVGYYPDGDLVLSRLSSLTIECICGNHDAMLLGKLPIDSKKDEIYGLKKQEKYIEKQNIEFLQGWALKREISINNRHILMVHGSPWDPLREYIYPDADFRCFENLPYDVIFLGHTHRPFIKKVGHTVVVNVGSCGLPRDQGDLLSFAIMDTTSGTINIVREKLDVDLLLNKYANVHPNVLQCLARKATMPIVGTRVGENTNG